MGKCPKCGNPYAFHTCPVEEAQSYQKMMESEARNRLSHERAMAERRDTYEK